MKLDKFIVKQLEIADGLEQVIFQNMHGKAPNLTNTLFPTNSFCSIILIFKLLLFPFDITNIGLFQYVVYFINTV